MTMATTHSNSDITGAYLEMSPWWKAQHDEDEDSYLALLSESQWVKTQIQLSAVPHRTLQSMEDYREDGGP